MRNLLAIVFILTIAVACDDGNPVTPKTKLLNVQVDASYTTDRYDNWVMVHDDDGRLLAFKPFESNTTFELETDQVVSDKITVTTVIHYLLEGIHRYSLYSYAKVTKGKTFHFKSYLGDPPTVTGMLKVTVSDVVAYDQFTLSSRLGFSGSASWAGNTKILDLQTSTYTGIGKYILTVSNGPEMKYKVFDNVKPSDSYNLSYNDMLPFDHAALFNFPTCSEISMYVYGSETGVSAIPNNYTIQSLYSIDPRSSLQVGYLNSLTNYVTGIYLRYPDYSLDYTIVGSFPNANNITWPLKTDFQITASSINDYSIVAKQPYIWRIGAWQFVDATNSVYWQVISPTDAQAFDEMPAEIIAQHSALSLSNMTYLQSTIYTQNIPYDDNVNNAFESKEASQYTSVGIGLK